MLDTVQHCTSQASEVFKAFDFFQVSVRTDATAAAATAVLLPMPVCGSRSPRVHFSLLFPSLHVHVGICALKNKSRQHGNSFSLFQYVRVLLLGHLLSVDCNMQHQDVVVDPLAEHWTATRCLLLDRWLLWERLRVLCKAQFVISESPNERFVSF